MSLRLAIAGHVDHGKSTLLGRLLSDSGQVQEDKARKVRTLCESTGQRFEYAFLLDALEEEQTQGVTIDITEVSWNYQGRNFTLIDTPGHREFLKNMVGGASRADAALLVVDVSAPLQTQFQRHAAVLGLLGVPRIIVALNKMDLIGWEEEIFLQRQNEVLQFFEKSQLPKPYILPVAAWKGVNLLTPPKEMPWYSGPPLARLLLDIPPPKEKSQLPMRLPLQGVYKFGEKRIYAGRIDAGSIYVGDEILFLPSGKKSRIASIEIYGEPQRDSALAGESIGFTLHDPLFLERGEIACSVERPVRVSQKISGDIFWLSPIPLEEGNDYQLRCGNAEVQAKVLKVESALDPGTLESATLISSGSIGRIQLELHKPLAFDFFQEVESTGRFLLSHSGQVAGGGRIMESELFSELSQIKKSERTLRNHHGGIVLWMTGLSGSGKSTIAKSLERKLFDLGLNTFVLDGDNIRQGICSDLGFSEKDRVENIRRVAEVAKLFAQAGLVTITSFISPFAANRAEARSIIGSDFLEIFVDCPLEICEKRDPKGLYARARRGEIQDFTGVSSPFEIPPSPNLQINTASLDPDAAVMQILNLLRSRGFAL